MRGLVLSLVWLVACGGGEANVARYCESTCGKFADCGFNQFVSEETCIDSCEVQQEDDDCAPTQAEADACLDAIEAAECDELADGTPPECDVECEGGGTDTADSGDGGGGGGGGGGVAASCTALQACCDTLDGGEKTGCEAIVATNTELGCSVALDGFIDEGICS